MTMETTGQTHSDARRLHWLALLLLIVAPYFVFSPALSFEFVGIDDGMNIYENQDVRALDWPHLQAMFTNVQRAQRYMPLGWMSYAVDQHFFGLNPFTYHLGNYLLHTLNGLLVFLLLRRLLQAAAGRAALEENPVAGTVAPFLGALWWAWHPLRVEPVAWSSARIYLVASAFFFWSVLAYLRGAQEESDGRAGGRWRGLAVLAFAASLLTYPVAIFGVCAFVLLEIYPLRRISLRAPWRMPAAVRNGLLPLALVAGLLFGLMLLCKAGLPQQLQSLDPPRHFGTLAHKFMQAFYVWMYFVWKPFFPLGLAPEYPTLLSFQPFTPPFVLSLLGMVFLSVVLFWRRHQWTAVWVAWLAHLALLTPLLGVVELRYHPGDRYSYIVGVIPAALLVGAAWRWRQTRWRRIGWAAGFAVVLAFGAMSAKQLFVWRDPVSLRRCIAERAEGSFYRSYAQAMLGATYYDAGSNGPAVSACQTALAGTNNTPALQSFALRTLGNVAQAEHRLEDAVAFYDQALGLDARPLETRINRGIALGKLGRLAEAEAAFRELVRAEPGHAGAQQNLSMVLELQGRTNEAALARAGQWPSAKSDGL